MINLPDYINWGYVTDHVRLYNQNPSDDLLYRIGTHVDALTPEDQDLVYEQNGYLNPEQRYRALNWLVRQNGIEIESDLAVLIFGREQLGQWLQI